MGREDSQLRHELANAVVRHLEVDGPLELQFESGVISILGAWRIYGEALFIASGDDTDGLPARVRGLELGRVAQARVHDVGDLSLTFSSGITLDVFVNSSTYDSWGYYKSDGVMIISGPSGSLVTVGPTSEATTRSDLD